MGTGDVKVLPNEKKRAPIFVYVRVCVCMCVCIFLLFFFISSANVIDKRTDRIENTINKGENLSLSRKLIEREQEKEMMIDNYSDFSK